MRKLVLALSALLLLITPALAREPEEAAMPDFGAQALEQALDGQTREALGDVSAASVGDFATQLWNIVTDALSNANLALRSALFSAGKVLAAGILCAFASGAQEDPGAKQPAQIAGAFAITALCTRDAQSMIALARETITKISDFTALLLPVLSSSLAASGGSVSAGTLLAGGSFAMSLLTKLASGVLIPLVYLYILLATAESATDGGGLGKIRELCGWAVRLSVKGLCAVFTAYLSLSRVLTGSADAMAVKAAQAAFSGMVPVVGSILSDASESLLASAGLIRSAAGAFGMLAVLAMALAPFARLGAFYLALRLAGAIGADAVSGGGRMMDAIRKYLISLCAAALLCALVRALVPGGRMKKLCSLLCGIFLMTAALSGISGWQLSDFAQELSKMQVAAEQARTGVEIRNREALCAIIKSKTEAYIWDKAQELDLSVSIEVMVEADGSYPYPSGVQITGAFTPQQRKTLEAYIEENLAIGKERQIWTNK